MLETQETCIQSLGREDLLEKEMASVIFARKISWAEELGRIQSVGPQRVRYD